ncbi:hypothetical protein [Streptomyces scabiei]|uniref:hypothetical protein n=1 Tax=Streptomyces scabiei TaxID=1930 RepID=UPI0029A3F338|nr:hypothetical protein [Streptomyces scabiei]MDX3206077.1 hypothetical protein [Streptomyces scabiei]
MFDTSPPSVALSFRGGVFKGEPAMILEYAPTLDSDWPEQIAEELLRRGGPELLDREKRELRERMTYQGRFRFVTKTSRIEVTGRLDEADDWTSHIG